MCSFSILHCVEVGTRIGGVSVPICLSQFLGVLGNHVYSFAQSEFGLVGISAAWTTVN